MVWSTQNLARGLHPGWGWRDPVQSGIKNKYCLDLDGINDNVTQGDVLDRAHTDAFSVAGWVKMIGGAGTDCPFSKCTGGLHGWHMRLNAATGVIQVYLLDGAAGQASRGTGVTTVHNGDWHLVGFSYDGSVDSGGIIITLDGSTVTSASIANTLATTLSNTAPMLIGGYASEAAPQMAFAGREKDVVAVGAELSTAQWTELFNGGQPGNVASMSFASDTDAWLRLGDGSADAYPTMYDQIGSYDGTMTNMAAGDIVPDSP